MACFSSSSNTTGSPGLGHLLGQERGTRAPGPACSPQLGSPAQDLLETAVNGAGFKCPPPKDQMLEAATSLWHLGKWVPVGGSQVSRGTALKGASNPELPLLPCCRESTASSATCSHMMPPQAQRLQPWPSDHRWRTRAKINPSSL